MRVLEIKFYRKKTQRTTTKRIQRTISKVARSSIDTTLKNTRGIKNETPKLKQFTEK